MNPILLLSSPRAGSTWTANILAAAPHIKYYSEPFNPNTTFGLSLVKKPRWYEYICSENELTYRALIDDMMELRRPSFGDVVRAEGQRKVLGRMWLSKYKNRSAYHRVLMKDPFACYSAEWLAERYQMQVIVLLRHPAAYVASRKAAGWSFDFRNYLEQPQLVRDILSPNLQQIESFVAEKEPPSLETGALQWNLIYGALLSFAQRNPDWLVVRHEDLCTNPIDRFGTLFEACRLGFDDNVVARIRATTATENPLSNRDGQHRIHRDSRVLVKKWKKQLSQREVETVREATESTAGQYYKDDDW